MKKLMIACLAILMAGSMAACGGATPASGSSTPATESASPAQASETPAADETYELALITSMSTVDDKSFNQGSWEGLVKYAEENDISHKYYQSPEQSDDELLACIDLAVKGGAKIVVTPGFQFGPAVYTAQSTYPDINFILVDGTPHNADYSDYRTDQNTVAIKYAEEQAGFLAGYAAVKDGNTKLGFMGGMAVPEVVKYGYGFVQGADYAAKELGLAPGDVTINYHYTGGFVASPEIQTMAASWYNDGAEVIFACGGAMGNSVMAAAEQTGKMVIGVDVDQSSESATVITSAMKGLTPSVYSCIADYYAGDFKGGETLVFDAANQGVGLPMETSKFSTFSQADYDAIFAKLADGSITLLRDVDNSGNTVELNMLPVELVSVAEIS